MVLNLTPPLSARNGHTIQVLGIARISGDKQDELSLEDQEALYRVELEANCELPFCLTMVTGTGSGERLDREDSARAYEELETGRYDVVISEDLSRIFRRVHAFLFCEAAEDVGTRVVTINDHIDTAQPNWRMHAFFASFHHEMANTDTSQRIRRTLRNRFSNGGVVQFAIYGYVKLPGSSHDDDLRKDPAAEPVYDHWFQMLDDGATFAAVADWLEAQGVKSGPFCRKKRWDGYMVGRITRNPILKGVRYATSI